MPKPLINPRAESANINIIEEGERVDQEVIVQYTQIVKQHKQFHNLANLDWVKAQSTDPVIPTVIDWVKRPKGDKKNLAEYLARVASAYEKCFYVAPARRNSSSRITSCICKPLPPIAMIPLWSLSFRLATSRLRSMDVTVAQDTRVKIKH